MGGGVLNSTPPISVLIYLIVCKNGKLFFYIFGKTNLFCNLYITKYTKKQPSQPEGCDYFSSFPSVGDGPVMSAGRYLRPVLVNHRRDNYGIIYATTACS